MCDTFVAITKTTADASVIFGKNSDRDPNEAHEVCIIPSADHPENSMVKCTYIEIPQVPHTCRVLLAKPFWIWGAEMGANEHGVVIGNEAVFSRLPAGREPGLIGMDYLRLALERSISASEALTVITNLLDIYGQSGNCGYEVPFYYHNSYIIADHAEAWVLETAGKHWVALKVESYASISNAYTIGDKFDLASKDVVNFAVDQGWHKPGKPFHFASAYSDVLYSTLGAGRSRQNCTLNALAQKNGAMTVKSGFEMLRDHTYGGKPMRFDRPLTGASVCMHAGFGPVRGSQTVGSMVSHLTGDLDTHWLTGTSAPCISTFKPVWINPGLAGDEWSAGPYYDPKSLWWRHEKLHRGILHNFDYWRNLMRVEIENLEREWIEKASANANSEFTAACLTAGSQLDERFEQRLAAEPPVQKTAFYYRAAWQRWSKKAGF